MKEILIESPNGERIKATKKAYEVIYKPLYGYKIVEEIKEEVVDSKVNEQVDSKPKGRGRRPKIEVGE